MQMKDLREEFVGFILLTFSILPELGSNVIVKNRWKFETENMFYIASSGLKQRDCMMLEVSSY